MLTTFPFLAARGRQIMSRSHEITTLGFLVDLSFPPTSPFLFKNDGKICCALYHHRKFNISYIFIPYTYPWVVEELEPEAAAAGVAPVVSEEGGCGVVGAGTVVATC